MGSDSQPPYIYEAPLQHKSRIAYPYSDFNPRAYTQASYAALQSKQERDSRPKSTGPLINFNQHPDSYMVVSGQNVKYEPMPENTKTRMKWVWGTQLSLRVIQELGALGLLVCVICITGMASSLSWIFRIAPAWDAVITLYAIYHLARSGKSRPPGSSASYHMFALFMDTGLIPFYIFIAIFANNNYNMPGSDQERWKSFFSTTADTTIVLLVTFIASAVLGGLHLVTGILDVWLIITFRQISKLPPDMNPLEDNLTARPTRATKHRYKNSESTLASENLSEKDWKHLSGSTLSVGATPLGKGYEIPDPRQMPFMHSRTDSNSTFSPHNPNTARLSRQQYGDGGLYDQPQRNDSMVPEKSPLYTETSLEVPQLPTHQSRQLRGGPYTSSNNNSPAHYPSPTLPNVAPTDAVIKSQQKQGLLNDNWYVLDDEADSPKRPTGDVADQHPLRMNPPTPNRSAFPDADEDDIFIDQPLKRSALVERLDKGNGALARTHSVATESSSVYSESAPSLKSSLNPRAAPKSKFYGDLASATMGVRAKPSNHSLNAHNAGFDATGMAGDYYGYAASPPPEKMNRSGRNAPANAAGRKQGNGGRVVSRTGVDIADSSPYYTDSGVAKGGFGVRERRDVSGKVAEEGRGGGGWMRAARWHQ